MSSCKIIAITNQKGGVGKMATTLNLGVELANSGMRRQRSSPLRTRL